MRNFYANIVSSKSNKYCIFRVCVYSLGYPARKAHAPYGYLWPVHCYNTFPHYLINGKILERKKVIGNKMCVLISSTNFDGHICHSKKQ